MKLKALTLENFKGISDPVRIEFAPVTLLFGPNNAGKSTVIHALLYAREIFERGNTNPRKTEMGGDVIDLGGFDNLVYRHDRNRKIRMRFELDLDVDELIQQTPGDQQKMVQELAPNVYRDVFWREDLEFGIPPDYTSVLTSLGPIWIDLVIGWQDGLQRCVVEQLSVGAIGSSTSGIVFRFDAESSSVRLTEFDLGDIPIGKQQTAESFAVDPERLEAIAYEKALAEDQERLRNEPPFAETEEYRALERLYSEKCNAMIQEYTLQLIDQWSKEDGASQLTEQEEEFRYARASRAAFKFFQEHQASALVVEVFGSDNSDSPTPSVAPEFLDTGRISWQEQKETDQKIWEQLLEQKWMSSFELCQSLLGNEWSSAERGLKGIPLTGISHALPLKNESLAFVNSPYLQSSVWRHPAHVGTEFFEPVLQTLVSGTAGCMRSLLNQSTYICSSRVVPPRDFHPVFPIDPQRWPSGLAAWDMLMIKEPEFVDEVNNWLTGPTRFDSGYAIDIARIKELDTDAEVISRFLRDDGYSDLSGLRDAIAGLPIHKKLRIRDLNREVVGSPQDFGHGISQVLPVIVAALHTKLGKESRAVMIEEPEANIHPAFQVVLADLFITQAKANPSALFLIETHSEHLMLRVMRRMRETFDGKQQEELAIGPSDVSVLFVERRDNRTRLRRMPLNEAGELVKAWPGGFFEEGLREQFGDD